MDRVHERGNGYYDAVLMDIRMPVMNGYDAAKQTRSLDNEYAKRLPISAMSANAYEEDARESPVSGMNRHVAKPFEPQMPAAELYKRILGQQWSRPIRKNTGVVHGDEEEET